MLGLRHIRDYRSLLDQLRKHIKLPTPPPRPLPLRLGVQTPQQSQPAAQSTKEQQQQLMTLPTYPSHIGPLSTAGQTQAITTTQNSTRCPPVQGSNTWTDLATERDCAWHPFCDQKQRECGGTKKCHCRKYGLGLCTYSSSLRTRVSIRRLGGLGKRLSHPGNGWQFLQY